MPRDMNRFHEGMIPPSTGEQLPIGNTDFAKENMARNQQSSSEVQTTFLYTYELCLVLSINKQIWHAKFETKTDLIDVSIGPAQVSEWSTELCRKT